MSKIKNIVIITTGQPSVNPRVVKEANALTSAGHQVIVLYCFWIGWAQKADKKIFEESKWSHKQVGGTPLNNKWIYWATRIQFKLVKTLNSLLGNVLGIAELSQARCYNQLLNAAKNIQADWYIGHNLGSLAIVVKAAKFNFAKSGFDFEDYHREENDPMTKVDKKRIEYLENKYLPQVHYVSTASPLITQQIKSDFRELEIPITTLNNTFSINNQHTFKPKADNDITLQLFWFSQTVGTGRGLETVLQTLKMLNDKTFHLTLVGNYTNEVRQTFETLAGSMAENIHFVGVVEGDSIPQIASSMDIGLALEQNTPLNRDICLTNKIFTYLLAGNAIIFTDTNAQIKFQKEYEVGLVYYINNVEQCSVVLNAYKTDRKLLNLQREKNWQLANKTLNWERESEKLLNVIN